MEIRASSMVPENCFDGHDGGQNLSAHSLVGVACGRDGCERGKKKVIILCGDLTRTSYTIENATLLTSITVEGKGVKRMKPEGTFWESRKDRISLPHPSEPRPWGSEPLGSRYLGLVRGSTFVPKATRRLATVPAPRLKLATNAVVALVTG